MAAQAFPSASLICMGRGGRAELMREISALIPATDATEFREGMHARLLPGVEHTLAQRQLLALPAQDLTVLCLAGELWLTREGDIEDYILGPGQRFSAQSGNKVTLQALQPSRLRLVS